MSAISSPRNNSNREIIAFLAAATAIRLLSIFITGFCDDEAYTVAISRHLALSYFDHPPLHQWVLWAWVAVFGEGRAARAPFFAFTLVTTGALYGLTRRLFSPAAAQWAVFGFSASAYFLVYPDGYILPDTPLFAFSALAAWAVAEILFGPPRRANILWPSAGLALGLAGLSKYSAVFVPLGLLGFVVGSPRARRWLADPRPYLGALLGALCLTPVIVWNGQHGWVSLAFQSARAAHKLTFDLKVLLQILGEVGVQAASVTPWIGLALIAGLARARRAGADSPERFLLWLSAPPLVLFLLMPLGGARPVPHWFNSGWLFAFPLAGAWLAERAPAFQRRFFAASAGLAGVVSACYLAAVVLGPLAPHGIHDPTSQMFDWPQGDLRAAYARAGADFALVDDWRIGGRVGVALGPSAPVCAMGEDPRGFAFACDTTRLLGRNALIIRANNQTQFTGEKSFFAKIEPLGDLKVGRRGVTERVLRLDAGRDLLSAPPLPYGP